MAAESLSGEFLSFQRAIAARYSLRHELGRGGMGIVFLARDLTLERNVAIKLLPPTVSELPEFRERFLREARVAAKLSHPNIVAVHSVEEAGPYVYFVMGLVDGESLGARIRRLGRLSSEEVARFLQQSAWALAHAHAHGVTHRDIKPDNILVEATDGRILISDFGIASGVLGSDSQQVAAGTPLYLSPEQAEGAVGGPLSDLYALGVTAWYALVGRHPHEGQSVAAILAAKRSAPAPELRTVRPEVPPSLAATVDRLLQRDPAARFESAEELARALDSVRAVVRTAPRSVSDAAAATLSLPEESLAVTTAVVSSGLLGQYFSAGGNLFEGIIGASAGTAMAGLALFYGAFRLTRWVSLIAHAVRDGADRTAVLRCAEELQREDIATRSAASSRVLRALALVIGGIGATAAAYWTAKQSSLGVLGFVALVAAGVLPVPFVWKLAKLRKPKVGRGLGWLRSAFGAKVFGAIARWTQARRPATAQPTATLLGADVSALFALLPEGQRREFSELPRLVARLEEEAIALRAGDGREIARANEIHAALEGMRLELVALRLERGDSAGLTQWVERGREIGRLVSAELGSPTSRQTPREENS